MDVDATISSSHNRRTVNIAKLIPMSQDVIGYHGKSLEGSSTWRKITSITATNFYITINE